MAAAVTIGDSLIFASDSGCQLPQLADKHIFISCAFFSMANIQMITLNGKLFKISYCHKGMHGMKLIAINLGQQLK